MSMNTVIDHRTIKESTETLSRTSKDLTAFIPPQFVNYNTVICDI